MKEDGQKFEPTYARYMNKQVKVFDTPEKLFESTSLLVSQLLLDTISLHGKCEFVLSGGSTPIRLYQLLGNGNASDVIPWNKVNLFWGDERCVPPDSSESNYKLAFDNLISKIYIPPENIFRIPGEKPHDLAALEYEKELREHFEDALYPIFDVVLLGLGEDGHTASLFQKPKRYPNGSRWIIDVYVPKKKMWRITMSLPVLNNAKTVIFLVSGKEKSKIVRDVLTNKESAFPAARIIPLNGELIWCLDKDAAGSLKI